MPIQTSIIIPVFNEASLIEETVSLLLARFEGKIGTFEIIIANNGSTDETAKKCEALAAKRENVKFVSVNEKGPGLGFKAAIHIARGDYVVTLDADLSSDLGFVEDSIKLLSSYDAVIGSKTFGSQRRTLLRITASQLYILCAELLFDTTISDFSIGCKAFKRSLVLPVIDHLDPWTGYIVELVLLCRCQKHRLLQIGVDCDDRRESRFNLLGEGVYRIKHLFRCRTLLSDPNSWLYRAK